MRTVAQAVSTARTTGTVQPTSEAAEFRVCRSIDVLLLTQKVNRSTHQGCFYLSGVLRGVHNRPGHVGEQLVEPAHVGEQQNKKVFFCKRLRIEAPPHLRAIATPWRRDYGWVRPTPRFINNKNISQGVNSTSHQRLSKN